MKVLDGGRGGGVISRCALAVPAFTEHRHSKSLNLCTLINLPEYQ